MKRQPTLYGYSRVSDPRQVEGLSLEAQAERIRKTYENHFKDEGYRWGDIYAEEGVSASKIPFRSRPIGSVLNAVLAAGDVICILRLDRAFRSVHDCSEILQVWERRGIKLCSVSEGFDFTSPNGKVAAYTIAICAQLESSMNSQRVKDSNAVRRARGERTCPHPPLCFTWSENDNCLVPFEPERMIANMVIRWWLKRKRFRDMAAHLNKSGIKKPKKPGINRPEGTRWTSENCNRLFYTEVKLRFFLKHNWPLIPQEFFWNPSRRDESRTPLDDRYYWQSWVIAGFPKVKPKEIQLPLTGLDAPSALQQLREQITGLGGVPLQAQIDHIPDACPDDEPQSQEVFESKPLDAE